VRDGLVTRAAARDDYGVVVRDDGTYEESEARAAALR
jgi:hypothetical protein